MLNNNLDRYYGSLTVNIESFNKIYLNSFWKDQISLISNVNNLKYIIQLLKEIRNLHAHLNNILYSKILLSNNTLIKIKLVLLDYINCLYSTLEKVRRILNCLYSLFTNIKIVRFPMRKKLIKTLKSPHVFNKGQDHFEIRKFKVGIKLPLLMFNFDYISGIIEQCTNLDPMHRITFKKKEIFLLKKYNL